MSDSLVVGGFFAEGEELARVESLDYETAVSRAEAALLRAEAELEHSKFELMRMRSLKERKLASRSNLENALRMYRVNTAAQLGRGGQSETGAGKSEAHNFICAVYRTGARQKCRHWSIVRGQPIATVYANSSVEVRLPVADRQLAFLNIPPTQRGELPLESQPSVKLTANYAGQQLDSGRARLCALRPRSTDRAAWCSW